MFFRTTWGAVPLRRGAITLGRRHPMRRGLGLGANRGNQPSAPSYRVKESLEGHIGEALRGVSSTAPPPTQGLLGGDHLSVVAGHSFRPLRLMAFCSRSVALGGGGGVFVSPCMLNLSGDFSSSSSTRSAWMVIRLMSGKKTSEEQISMDKHRIPQGTGGLAGRDLRCYPFIHAIIVQLGPQRP